MAIRVLVVDDEIPILEFMKAKLEPLGCEVVTMSDSRQAAQFVEHQKLDGVFLDAAMPVPDGFQLTEIIRSSKSNNQVPIVMLTGRDDAESMRRGFRSGISFFLGKPITGERLEKLFMVMRGAMLTEKRRYVRLPFHTTVTCEVNKKSVRLDSINISAGGMLLAPTESVTVGHEFDLEFSLPQVQAPLRVRAKALHYHPRDGVGIQFINLSSEEVEAIRGYIIGAM
jgi:CheY-like chemotaxis protein